MIFINDHLEVLHPSSAWYHNLLLIMIMGEETWQYRFDITFRKSLEEIHKWLVTVAVTRAASDRILFLTANVTFYLHRIPKHL